MSKLSEVKSIENFLAAATLDLFLRKSVHDSPTTFVIIFAMQSLTNVIAKTAEVPVAIWSYIFQYAVWDLTKDAILILITKSSLFHEILRPYVYRHIHLSDLETSINCLEALVKYPNLCCHVRTLAVSTGLEDDEDSENGEDGEDSGGDGDMGDDLGDTEDSAEDERLQNNFWTLIKLTLPKMGNLTCFTIFYRHEDTDSLFRWVINGVPIALPDSLKKLSFVPIAFDGWENSARVCFINLNMMVQPNSCARLLGLGP